MPKPDDKNIERALKSCPFCNATPHRGPAKIQYDQMRGEPFQRYRIWCPHGCACIDRMNEEQAIAAWNARTLQEQDAFADALERSDFANVASALNERMCCNGQMCGCRGLTVGEYLAYELRATLRSKSDA